MYIIDQSIFRNARHVVFLARICRLYSDTYFRPVRSSLPYNSLHPRLSDEKGYITLPSYPQLRVHPHGPRVSVGLGNNGSSEWDLLRRKKQGYPNSANPYKVRLVSEMSWLAYGAFTLSWGGTLECGDVGEHGETWGNPGIELMTWGGAMDPTGYIYISVYSIWLETGGQGKQILLCKTPPCPNQMLFTMKRQITRRRTSWWTVVALYASP